ncbi:putative cyclophilin 12 [Leishmania infantum JPCM5]|uniref:Cyclophilin_12_-_putative n=3 Tax=Leishmania donovani species complex TaxID=38574 RepID=A0A6L0WKV4_LEIIN|nr:putative cyclophilin 12 [Leishmania infantum JPCM5]XP_003857835.1 cyclophilin type peptidyl-prolyl cis-trans isomerase, putative [Leishmania donovani]CAC9436496.1 cyclophilin_12_-_putative [Leishmania infantum]AYU75533.1 cyclophilin 12, putative [Leishmania donovani]TPP54556.1 Cyclophilin type peptidyl-prolyl cis-trans isomerase/CLD family protein [Leishmania donovani]CAM65173.1 putative cyclophilin 12 [Leishmania infantum JPCM5]CBZ31109.1 cyclophilin type peptidyl-prolyl cis-trans isomera|eukprot:XP_001462635.1 putative cyclophilin 12 [Leishmania infantum JPCM5]
MKGVTSFTVYGLVTAADFQRCAEAAAHVNDKYPESYAVVVKLELPRDFAERRAAWASAGQLPSQQQPTDTSFCESGGPATTASAAAAEPASVLVEQHGSDSEPQRLLTAETFLHNIATHTDYKPDATEDYYTAQGKSAWRAFLASRGRQYCWMDVSVDGVAVGRVWFELYATVAPLTCKNFCELCRGTTVATGNTVAHSSVFDPPPSQHIGYKGTTFFRTLKDAWVMGGDVTGAHSGNGGYSCYGRCFPDETYAVPHDAAGILGMCNDGPHTNSSAFYITLRPMSWMNGKYVAFGRVMDGMHVVDAIHAVEVRHNQAPKASIVITDCEVLDTSV